MSVFVLLVSRFVKSDFFMLQKDFNKMERKD